MAVTAEDLTAVESVLAREPERGAALAALRQTLPQLRFLACDAADVIEEPLRSFALVDLHLLDCSGHCVQMVGEAARASGVLLAWRRAV